VSGVVPVAATLSVADAPDGIVWLCGCAVRVGGAVTTGGTGAIDTVIVAVFESMLPAVFDTRTQ
jgi:hypothetical protein